MSKNSESLNRSLYDLLRGKGYKPKMLTTAGKASPVPEDASVFIFNFIKDGKDYGQVSASIDGSKKLIVYYDDEVADSPNTNTSGTQVSDSWSTLIEHLSQWRFRNGLRSFELKNQDHLEPDMAQREYMRKKESVTEGYHPMGRQASYNDNIPNAKIIIQHSRKLEEGEQRYRNIARIFVENANGERFLVPTTKPGIAQVYARHIAEGGTPYDEKAQHISSLVEEHSKMAGFVRATRNGQFNESTERLVQEGVNHYHSLRECLSKMRTHRGYQAYFESWTPPLMEDELDESTINELFVQETMDPRIESVLPILSKLQKNIGEAVTMKEVDALSEWADSLLEGGDGGEADEEADIDTDGDAGQDSAEDADEDLTEGEMDALNPVGIPEGRLDGSDEIDSPVASAITRRILLQRTDLLAKYGPEAVADAIANIADDLSDWIGPDDEIGSSDVSGWVKRVEQELSSLGEGEPGDLEHELERQDYEHDRDRDEQAEKEMNEAERPGLWANIHAKRERIKHGSGEKMRKPGSKGAPTAQNFRDAAKEDVEEALDPEKKQRLQDLIDKYADATDPEYMGDDDYEDIISLIRQEFGDRTADSIANGPSMHFPRPGHAMGHDDLEFKQMRKNLSPNRITKAGKLHKQDSDAMKRDIRNKFDVEEGLGDVAKKVGGAVKAGAKAVGKAIVGKDDDELLRDLKKRAGVRNPQTGKPSMAHSDVEKVDEVDLGQYDAVKTPLKGKDTSDWDKNFREKLKQYTKELDQRQKEKKEKSEKVDEGEANLEKALDTLSGSWSNWNKDESTNPNIESYWYDDGEGNHYASGRIEHDLRTGKITVDYEGEYGEEVKGTFDSVGAAMNALRGGYPASHGGKAPNYDSLANKTLAGPDDLYKTDKAGKKGTLTKARMQGMKASSPYTMRGGPKGVLPEGEFAGDYATGEAGQWRNKGPKANKPATVGDLVGESQLAEMDSEGYKGIRDDGDSKGPEGKAKEIKGKDFAKAAKKELDKQMDKAHKKEVKEGQEDLDAILRIIKK